LNLFGRKTRKSRTPAKSRRPAAAAKRGAGNSAMLRRWRLVLAAAAVMVLIGTGLVNWMGSRRGQAVLLGMGAQKMYADVQATVETALTGIWPDLPAGPVSASTDHDWPAPAFGPGAMIRCRRVTVPANQSWWEIQAGVSVALDAVGARVLWGERLLPERLDPDQLAPNEERDLLRLDVGVTGRPTHTLVLARPGAQPNLQWGGGPGLTRWAEFSGSTTPSIALIIDDWGQGKTGSALSILDLPVPLTLAVLPDLPYSRFFSLQRTELVLPPGHEAESVAAARVSSRATRLTRGCFVEVTTGRHRVTIPAQRREVFLHLPMQPEDYPGTNPGPDAVLVGMSEDDIRLRLETALGTLTAVTGVNNHMGSAATSDTPTMRNLMSVLKNKDLIFVDSLTTARSVAYAEAVRADVPAARNRIFLDYDNENEAAIATNLQRLVNSARSSGLVVGIGHPHPATAAVLEREIPRLLREGVRFVTVSELMALRDLRTAAVPGAKGK
jgi:polysaccharide deacetylase 2 family uncharacterized protein YibQ